MKKAINFVKKHDSIIIFLIIAIILLGKNYYVIMENYDELINFTNIYKMANGVTIYKEINIIITPLFFYMGEIILKIFGENILVFRTFNFILTTILYLLCYKTFKELKIAKTLSLLYTIIIMIWTYDIASTGANYNILAYIFFEIGLISILKNKNEIKKNIIQGVILFLVCITNHKLGAGYLIALVVFEICNKNLKSLLKELIIAIIPAIIYIIFLICNNNLYNFINYVLLGIGEFATENIAKDMKIELHITIATITGFLYYVLLKNLRIHLDEKIIKNLKTLLIFSISAIIIIIPIVNEYHLKLGFIIFLVSLMYGLNILIYPIIEDKDKIIKVLTSIIILVMTILSIKNTILYISTINNITKDSPFYGSIIKEELKKEIEEVSNYIENNEKDTIILSTYAPFYAISLNDLDNGVYDWPLKGNLGKEGEEGLIENISQLKNTQILLYKEEKEIYQFTDKTRDYIKENFKYINNIQNFYIYETKN